MSLKNAARKTSRGGGKHPPPCGVGLNFEALVLSGTQGALLFKGDLKRKFLLMQMHSIFE